MAAIKREPAPFGPVSDLFDRLHDLHLAAGQPSLRQIATRIGRGVVSSSTVHNMFRGPRVPKWGFLELVVEELGGNVAEFRGLWQAARLAEEAADNPGMTAARGNGGLAAVSPEPGTSVSSPLLAAPTGPAAPGTPHRIWSNENPQRNLHFTGRVAELEALRANLTRDDRPHPPAQLISGMGGVGKTEQVRRRTRSFHDSPRREIHCDQQHASGSHLECIRPFRAARYAFGRPGLDRLRAI